MDYAEKPARRDGCFKFACGGCVLLILAGVMLTVFAWWYLGRWGRGESAWEQLPPSVCVAVEVHDIRRMLQHALEDPALVSIIGKFAGDLEEELPSIAEFDYTPSGDGHDLVELYREYGFLHTVLAPNVALLSLTAADELLIIAKLPAYASIYMPEVESGKVVSWEDDLYLARVDGWTAISNSDALLAELLDNWDKPASPLGPRFSASTPFAHIGYKHIDQPAAPPAGQPDAPMMLGNPFAAQTATVPTGQAINVIVQPREKNWAIHGAAVWDRTAGDIAALLGEKMEGGKTGEYPALIGDSNPVSMALYANREHLRHALEKTMPETAARIAPYLDAVQGDLILEARPALYEDPYILPAPVITVGIPIVTESAANAIAIELAQLTDAPMTVQEPDHPLSRALVNSVTITPITLPAGTGVGRIITLPPELANAVNPSWLVETSPAPTAWFSTDPSGLEQRAHMTESLAATKQSRPGSHLFRAALSWNMTDAFRRGVYDLLIDRLSMIPDDSFPQKEKVLDAAESINALLQWYPQAAMSICIDPTATAATFTATVPPGVD